MTFKEWLNTFSPVAWSLVTKEQAYEAGRASMREEIAVMWDACMYESIGEDIDIGAAIRSIK